MIPILLHGSIFVHCGRALLEGDGTLLQCSTRDGCMVLGDLAGSGELIGGILYGTTYEGGTNPDCNCGVVFAVTP